MKPKSNEEKETYLPVIPYSAELFSGPEKMTVSWIARALAMIDQISSKKEYSLAEEATINLYTLLLVHISKDTCEDPKECALFLLSNKNKTSNNEII